MSKLKQDDLMSLEEYDKQRQDFRSRLVQHKQNRRVHIGEHATLYFEDRLTIQYQIQEMLRIERIFEQQGIKDELDVYNALIPDGSNWKATFMLEYEDAEERKVALAKLKGVEDEAWIRVKDHDRVYALADEDLERQNDEKTSAVHFMRFELSQEMCETVKNGANISMGIDHENLSQQQDPIPRNIRDSLAADLN